MLVILVAHPHSKIPQAIEPCSLFPHFLQPGAKVDGVVGRISFPICRYEKHNEFTIWYLSEVFRVVVIHVGDRGFERESGVPFAGQSLRKAFRDARL
jgi:hypothetical protein